VSLAAGTRFGGYEVVSPIGAGGMGEVYRARDLSLNRTVALKILPPLFANDADRLARFKREGQVLASLNHPNIAAIHGLEESGGVRALVLEYVDGPTLADRIAAGPMALDDALAIARQIADALEAAHDHGVVHRDLKPANVKLRPDGTVKVLDFGLAKEVELRPTGSDTSPTITSPAVTGMGMILGTAAYMSPEQARGKPVDKRADLWAFGCVLFEMLTGRRAFDAPDVTSTLAKVLESTADLDQLPAGTPASIRRLLRRCLVRERRDRLGDASSIRIEIDEALRDPRGAAEAAIAPARHVPWWRRGLPWPIAALVVAALAIAGYAGRFFRADPPRAVSRLDIALPPGDSFPERVSLAITPDGQTVFYGADRGDKTFLFKRKLDDVEAVMLPGTEAGTEAFVTPGGDWLVFATMQPSIIKRMPIAGGPVTEVVRPRSGVRGIGVLPDGDLVFGEHALGLFRAPRAGEPPISIAAVTPDGPPRYPVVLPGNRGLVYTVGGIPSANHISVLATGTTTPRRLTAGTFARYLPTGHLLFWREGSLWIVPFDATRLELTGDAVPAVDRVGVTGNGYAHFAVAENGTLAYIPAVDAPQRTLVWVDRNGKESPLDAPAGPYASPRISPDGKRIALGYRTDAIEDLWMHDIERRTTEAVAAEPASEWTSAWVPDSQRVLFTSRRAGPFNLYSRRANGLGEVELVTKGVGTVFGSSPDYRRVLLEDERADGQYLGMFSLDDKSTRPLWKAAGLVSDAQFSPDGRWIAYSSRDSGDEQIWVRPFPEVDANRWRISTDGGRYPRWSADGRTMFYQRGQSMMSVTVRTGSGFAFDPPVRIFGGPYSQDWDLARDGRFLMVKNPPDTPVANRIIVIQNWLDDLFTSSSPARASR
jgi:eukaryotic-like serine/threonine-protein kinase